MQCERLMFFFFSSRRRHTRLQGDWSSDVCSSDLVTMIMGQVVSFVRETVRQLIADLVGKLISWVMEEVFSLGFGTPVVVAQASAAIAKWGKKIGELLKKLTDTIRQKIGRAHV